MSKPTKAERLEQKRTDQENAKKQKEKGKQVVVIPLDEKKQLAEAKSKLIKVKASFRLFMNSTTNPIDGYGFFVGFGSVQLNQEYHAYSKEIKKLETIVAKLTPETKQERFVKYLKHCSAQQLEGNTSVPRTATHVGCLTPVAGQLLARDAVLRLEFLPWCHGCDCFRHNCRDFHDRKIVIGDSDDEENGERHEVGKMDESFSNWVLPDDVVDNVCRGFYHIDFSVFHHRKAIFENNPDKEYVLNIHGQGFGAQLARVTYEMIMESRSKSD